MSAEPWATFAPCDSNYRSIGENRLLHGIVRPHVQVSARARDVDDGWPAALDVDIAFGHHVLHGVVRLEQQGAFVGGQGAVWLLDARVFRVACRGVF